MRPQPEGAAGPPRAAIPLRRAFDVVDRACDRLYGASANPLYQSGTLAILFFLVAMVSGLYLFIFYRIADPHGSVVAIQETLPLGGFTRSLHRLSADLAVVATLVHVGRKLVQGQTWGPRGLAWLSGVFLLGLTLVSGWTGLVMVWDSQGQRIAVAGARLLDLAPLFSMPLERSFDGSGPVPSSFFFMNLFLHVALPLGVAALLWLHLSRLARPRLLPPRALAWGAVVAIGVVAAWSPGPRSVAADLLSLPGRAPLDLFYAFWLPLAERWGTPASAAIWAAVAALLFVAPWSWRPRHPIATSSVDENRCTGCTICFQDCPYEAIAMVPRSDHSVQRSELVARVEPDRCVGCGICAGSCAPMGVGPTGRTGRDQLANARGLLADRPEVVVLLCANGGGGRETDGLAAAGVKIAPVSCGGNVHTALVQRLLRDGARGVMVVTCAPRNCSYREGPKWLLARLYEGREAELSPRVDRRRVRVAHLAGAAPGSIRRAIAEFRAELAVLEQTIDDFDLTAICEHAVAGEKDSREREEELVAQG